MSKSSLTGFLIGFRVNPISESSCSYGNDGDMEYYSEGSGKLTCELVCILETSNYFRGLDRGSLNGVEDLQIAFYYYPCGVKTVCTSEVVY